MHVLIADDHPMVVAIITKAVRQTFSRQDTSTRVVSSGSDLMTALRTEAGFDLLVLDLFMPGAIQRIELLKAVRAVEPELPILIHTSADNPCVLRAALDAGVRGYVTKRGGWSTFIEALRRVSAGQSYIDSTLDFTLATMHPWFDLTPSERKICLHTALGVPTNALARSIGRAYTTVATHKTNALRKLGLVSEGQLASYIYNEALDYEFDADALRNTVTASS